MANRTFKDYAGQRFGRLVLLRFSRRSGRVTYWMARCDCGREVEIVVQRARSGNTRSCGCLRRELSRDRFIQQGLPRKPKDYVGRRFGRLVLLKFYERRKKATYWVARCNCGKKVVVSMQNLFSGATTSCGCRLREVTGARFRTHGMCKTPTYGSWAAMHARCRRNTDYILNGIVVCKRWSHPTQGFINFFKDMGERPPGHTLDRKNNYRGYSLGNCRWATVKEQARNQRGTRLIVFKGKTRCLAAWAEEIGISTAALWLRLRRWPVDLALTRAPRKARVYV